MNTINYESLAILRGYNSSGVLGGNGLIIDEGKLSDMINRALALPKREYHGLTITFDDSLLKRNDIEEMFKRKDFPR